LPVHLPTRHERQREATQPIRAFGRNHSQGQGGQAQRIWKNDELQKAENQIVIDYEVDARRPYHSDPLVAAIETHLALQGRRPALGGSGCRVLLNQE
jgi:hypothetical protein